MEFSIKANGIKFSVDEREALERGGFETPLANSALAINHWSLAIIGQVRCR